MTNRSFIALGDSIEPGRIFRVIFPNPPAVIRPFIADITVSISKNNHAGRFFDARGTAEVVLITGRSAKWRGSATPRPMHVHCRDSAEQFNFTVDSQSDKLGSR